MDCQSQSGPGPALRVKRVDIACRNESMRLAVMLTMALSWIPGDCHAVMATLKDVHIVGSVCLQVYQLKPQA